MTSLEFKRDSWHYKIAKSAGLKTYGGETDMCTYLRHFGMGVLMWTFLSTLVVFIAACFVDLSMAIMVSFMFGSLVTLSGMAILAVLIISVVLLIGVATLIIAAVAWAIEKLAKRSRSKKEDGFISNAYKGWKEKYCAKIQFAKTAEEIRQEQEHEEYRAEYRARMEATKVAVAATDTDVPHAGGMTGDLVPAMVKMLQETPTQENPDEPQSNVDGSV